MAPGHTRRAVAAVPVMLAASACATDPRPLPPWPGPPRYPLIDAHCHLFNGRDLPAARFLRIVLLKDYRAEPDHAFGDIEDPDVVDMLIAFLVWLLAKSAAPTADREIEVLQKQHRPARGRVRRAESEREVADAAAAYFLSPPGSAAQDDLTPAQLKARGVIGAALLSAGRVGDAAPDSGPVDAAQAAKLSRRAISSKSSIGRTFRWFSLFTRYRFALADELAATHKAHGFGPCLLAPALVDYDLWLGERVTASPLPTQVRAMGLVGTRRDGPAVHGYVAFDPLRAAYAEKGLPHGFEPLDLVREAVENHGFLGMKLYPPMGFKPLGNQEPPTQRYPRDVEAAFGPGLGAALDRALHAAFRLCEGELDAAVLAHASATVDAGPRFSYRGDPAFWLKVFRTYPRLRICLAHFGDFRAISAGSAEGAPAILWEERFGAFVRDNPNAPVFYDVSYFSEIFGKSATELDAYATRLRAYVADYDPECQHLVFGTDWVMLGREAGWDGYDGSVYDFLTDSCGLKDERLQRILFGNAARLLGLRDGDAPRARLLKLYAARGLPPERLPRFATV